MPIVVSYSRDKNQKPKICDRAYLFGVVGCRNQIKNGRVISIESWGKSGVLAYLWLKNGYFWLKIGYFWHIFLG